MQQKNVMGGIFLLFGLGAFAWGLLNYLEASDSETWPEVKGVVKTSTMKSRISTNRSNKNRIQSRSNVTININTRDPNRVYSPNISYEYTVNGAKFNGTRVGVSQVESSDDSIAREAIARYPAGANVTVKYNPNDPSKALLESGIGMGEYVLLGLGLLFSIFGAALLMMKPKEIIKSA